MTGRWPMVEGLEPRCLLSAVPAGAAFEVGTTASVRCWVSADAKGDTVVAWNPAGAPGVYAQRFEPDGTPIDPAPLVVSTSGSDDARVAMNATGNFAVTWEVQVPLRNGGWDWQVHARAFNAATGTFGSDVVVQNADVDIHFPSVAIDDNGGFVIAWRDMSGTRSNAPTNVYARLYSASGAALGKQFQVNTSGGTAIEARAAMDSVGNFIIAWHDTGLGQTLVRRYTAAGAALSGQTTVGADSDGHYNTIGATMDSAGDFLIAWQSSGVVYAQRYLSSGTPQWATPLQLGGDGTALFVHASMDGAGNAVVAWQQKDPVQNFDLYAQQFDSSGVALGGVENVTPYDASTGESDAWALLGVAAQPNNGFAIFWDDTSTPQSLIWGQQYIQQ